MNKNTFIRRLKEALKEGNINEQEIIDTVSYYEDYFEEKTSNGYRIEEVLDELGDPRLIAKTIIDTRGAATSSSDIKYKNEDNYNKDSYFSNEYKRYGNIHIKELKLKDKIKIGIYIFAFILLFIFMIIFAFKMIVFLLPIMLIVFIIYLLSRLFW